MPRLRFLRPSTGLGLEKRGIHPPIWSFIGRFHYLHLFACLLPALISASLNLNLLEILSIFQKLSYEVESDKLTFVKLHAFSDSFTLFKKA